MKVSVILLNYNSTTFTIECIGSIRDKTNGQLDYEIIVVDNGSSAEELNRLRDHIKPDNIKLITSNINLGFGRGNNLGAREASGEYIYFLNNDTVLLNDNLSILSRFMDDNPQAGICSGQMHNSDLSLHYSFSYFPGIGLSLFGVSFMRRFRSKAYPDRHLRYESPIKVDYVTGAAMFVRTKMFFEARGFDDNIFLFLEEEDLALRLNKAGYPAYFVPDAEFIHFGGKSTGKSFEIDREYYISFFYYLRKHKNWLEIQAFKLFYFIKNLRKFYKDKKFIRLAKFILTGANPEYSLKHVQKET
jgi:GT2 family glycosyltransferase